MSRIQEPSPFLPSMRDWCSEEGDCTLPGAMPAQPITAEVALMVCEQVEGGAAKANCVFDVMTTGNAGFATTYILAQNSQLRPRSVPQPSSCWCSMWLLLFVIGILAVLIVIVVVLRLRR